MIKLFICCTTATFAGCLIGLFPSPFASASESEIELSGEISFEYRGFARSSDKGQSRSNSGIVLHPSFYWEDSRGWSFNFSPRYRYDHADEERKASDVREAYYLMYGEYENSEWELRLGIDRVFWGVGEVANLVDIINQTDLVDDPEGKSKLGQMMIHYTWLGDWGAVETFATTDHRNRTYPGVKGRLRSELPIDNDAATYESDRGDDHVDYAIRYSNSIGSADIGFSAFKGTSREPVVSPIPPPPANPSTNPTKLYPHYEQIRQYGFDTAVTVGDNLLKLELIHRENASYFDAASRTLKQQDYSAHLIGGERTIYEIFDSNYDLTVLAEWLYDERGVKSPSQFQDDIFLAGRIAFNDSRNTELVGSIIQDRRFNTQVLTFEVSGRINDEWSHEVEWVDFIRSDKRDSVMYSTRRDSYIKFSLVYGF